MAKEKQTAEEKKSDWDRHVRKRWIEMCTLRKYFESLKVRDLIIGRIALFLLLLVSTLTIVVHDLTNNFCGKIIVSLLTVFPTVALYWVGKNGYVLSIAGLFHMIIDKNFSPLKNMGDIADKKMKCVEEQKLLLSNYAADCPDLTLLQVLHGDRIRKDANDKYRHLANNPRFRKKLEVNCCIFILAHFFACERIADKKIRIMGVIEDEVNKKQEEEDKKKKQQQESNTNPNPTPTS